MDFKLAVVFALFATVSARTCPGMNTTEFVHGLSIDRFAGCTIIDGDFRILEPSFNGDSYRNLPPIEPSQLYVLESVTDIMGHLVIQGEHDGFKNLNFLRNLKRIHGETQSYVGAALQVYGTGITSLELSSLELIKDGIVVIGHNDDLCYADRINWASLFTPGSDQRTSIKFNKPSKQCADEGHVCHPQCSADGCWGPGERNCLRCANYVFEGTCMPTCYGMPGLYAVDSRVCARCHSECDVCDGPGPNQCSSCRHYRFGATCVANCPDYDTAAQRYVYTERDATCQYCDEQCDGGCQGRGADVCLRCKTCMDDYRCVPRCPGNKYVDANGFCQFCDPECDGPCHGPGSNQCFECRNLVDDGYCVAECPGDKYAADDKSCQACDEECLYGCYGQGPFQCTACKHYTDGSQCVAACPSDKCADDDNVCGTCDSMPTYQELVEKVFLLENQAAGLSNVMGAAVAFTAYSMRERVDYYEGERLIFDGVITNVGNAYDPETSVFTCPRTGIYMFIVSVDNYMRGSLIPSLYRELEMIASAGAYNSASQNVIIHCGVDQKVEVRTNHGGSMFNMKTMRTSTFSGLFLAGK